MTDPTDVSNDTFTMYSSIEQLLRSLVERPASRADIELLFLNEPSRFLSDSERNSIALKVSRGALSLLSGNLKPISEAISSGMKIQADAAQRAVQNKLPADVQQHCQQFAETVLQLALSGGWIQCDEPSGLWRLTVEGIHLLERGGFHLR